MGKLVQLGEDYFTNRKKDKLAKPDSKEAAFLLGRKGQFIHEDVANKYGIKHVPQPDPKAAPKAEDKEAPKPEDKGAGKGKSKAGK